jgi:uncharacterized cupredoxin-like copper-binding protein
MQYGELQGREQAYPYDQSQRSGQDLGPEEQTGQIQHLRGKLTRTNRVQLPGMNEELLFGLAQTNQGKLVSLYLGPVAELKDVQVNRGDEIDVRGPILEVHGQPILLAQQLRIHGQTIPIAQRAREEMIAASQYINGRIITTRTIRIPGVNEPLRIAQVRTSDGRSIIAELGPQPRLEGLTLNRGDDIDIRGRAFRVANYRILLAERIRAHGETVTVGEGSRFNASTRRPGQQLIRMFAEGYRFNPTTIYAQPGELLDISLTNYSADVPHSIVFDLPGEVVGLQAPLEPGDSRIVTLRAPEQPGSYTFYCPVDDHADRGMVGNLIVTTQRYD